MDYLPVIKERQAQLEKIGKTIVQQTEPSFVFSSNPSYTSLRLLLSDTRHEVANMSDIVHQAFVNYYNQRNTFFAKWIEAEGMVHVHEAHLVRHKDVLKKLQQSTGGSAETFLEDSESFQHGFDVARLRVALASIDDKLREDRKGIRQWKQKERDYTRKISHYDTHLEVLIPYVSELKEIAKEVRVITEVHQKALESKELPLDCLENIRISSERMVSSVHACLDDFFVEADKLVPKIPLD